VDDFNFRSPQRRFSLIFGTAWSVLLPTVHPAWDNLAPARSVGVIFDRTAVRRTVMTLVFYTVLLVAIVVTVALVALSNR
jgi:hypothetical protein